MKNITKAHVKDFMKSVGIMSIAINHHEYPISSIVLFAVDDDFTLYFATHANTNKARALQSDPKLSFSIWEQHNLLIQGSGDVEILSDAEEINGVLDKLAKSAISIKDFWPPILQLEPDFYAVFKITPKQMQAIPLEYDTISADQMEVHEIDL